MEIESTLGKYCEKWSMIEATDGSKGMYSTKCAPECRLFSKELNTCIEIALKTKELNQPTFAGSCGI